MAEFLSLSAIIFAFIISIRIMAGFSLYSIDKKNKE